MRVPRHVVALVSSLSSLCSMGRQRRGETPYKIRVGFPSLAFSYMPYYVAQEKGILKQYGMESEYIQMRTGIQPQAVINGNINYLTSVSTGISAAVAGLPLVMVFSFCDTSPWILVTQKEINKPQDLIGKTVAVSGIRTSPYYFFNAFLKKSKSAQKDVGTISTGGTADSFIALTSNRVAGTVLTPPFDDKAVSLGYKKFMLLGDLADIPYVGLVTSQTRSKTTASWCAARSLRSSTRLLGFAPTATKARKMIVNKFKVNSAGGGKYLRDLDPSLNKDGRLNPKVARGYVDSSSGTSGPGGFRFDTLFDFSFLPGDR